MVYDKQQWRDGPGGTTPLSAARLSVIEQGISDAHDLAAPSAVREVAQDAMNDALSQVGWAYNDTAGTFTPPSSPQGLDQGAVESYLSDTATPRVVSANPSSGAYPARPATTRPVIFRGPTPPGTNGATAGGGGMVLGLDEWRLWSGTSAVTLLLLSQAPSRYQHTITLAEAKAAATRSVITSRQDIRILVVGGTSLNDWSSPWLLEPTDTIIGDAWDLIPGA